jgi:hypothetical protein
MREHIFRLRVSFDELQALRALAKARAMPLSELMRRAALGMRMPRVRFDRRQIHLLGNLLAELGRVGGNINQLARMANRGRVMEIGSQLPQALDGIETLRQQIREAIR